MKLKSAFAASRKPYLPSGCEAARQEMLLGLLLGKCFLGLLIIPRDLGVVLIIMYYIYYIIPKKHMKAPSPTLLFKPIAGERETKISLSQCSYNMSHKKVLSSFFLVSLIFFKIIMIMKMLKIIINMWVYYKRCEVIIFSNPCSSWVIVIGLCYLFKIFVLYLFFLILDHVRRVSISLFILIGISFYSLRFKLFFYNLFEVKFDLLDRN